MVKTKSKKSVIALVVMAILLVLSMAMTITGAWFSDQAKTEQHPLEFGTVDITSVSEDLVVGNTIDTTTYLMPGSTLTGDLTVVYGGNTAAHIRYRVVLEGAGAEYVTSADETDTTDDREWQYFSCAAGATTTKAIALSVKTSVGNAAQGLPVTVVIEVEAIQQANTDDDAEEAFKLVLGADNYENEGVVVPDLDVETSAGDESDGE